MIFEARQRTITVTMGICPICDKVAEPIQSTKEVKGESEIVHSNEYYTHYKINDIDYIKKKRNPKTLWT
jgi:hypothetical protein